MKKSIFFIFRLTDLYHCQNVPPMSFNIFLVLLLSSFWSGFSFLVSYKVSIVYPCICILGPEVCHCHLRDSAPLLPLKTLSSVIWKLKVKKFKNVWQMSSFSSSSDVSHILNESGWVCKGPLTLNWKPFL